jgi:hypothetical protein
MLGHYLRLACFLLEHFRSCGGSKVQEILLDERAYVNFA